MDIQAQNKAYRDKIKEEESRGIFRFLGSSDYVFHLIYESERYKVYEQRDAEPPNKIKYYEIHRKRGSKRYEHWKTVYTPERVLELLGEKSLQRKERAN